MEGRDRGGFKITIVKINRRPNRRDKHFYIHLHVCVSMYYVYKEERECVFHRVKYVTRSERIICCHGGSLRTYSGMSLFGVSLCRPRYLSVARRNKTWSLHTEPPPCTLSLDRSFERPERVPSRGSIKCRTNKGSYPTYPQSHPRGLRSDRHTPKSPTLTHRGRTRWPRTTPVNSDFTRTTSDECPSEIGPPLFYRQCNPHWDLVLTPTHLPSRKDSWCTTDKVLNKEGVRVQTVNPSLFRHSFSTILKG